MDDKDSIIMANSNTIKCKNCKWAQISESYLEFSCMRYSEKPYDVYFESAECPKYEEDEEDNE